MDVTLNYTSVAPGTSSYSPGNNDTSATPRIYTDYEFGQFHCMAESYNTVQRLQGVLYCEPSFDNVSCWTAVPANSSVQLLCPIENSPPDIFALRYCSSNGSWDEKSDYSQCINYINYLKNFKDEPHTALMLALRDIYFGCSIVSLICLIITLFIFMYFRSLQCNRISIHKNLVVSFIIRFVVLMVMIEPFITGRQSSSYRNVDWLCKIIIAFNQYTVLANIYWMFVEGLFLHNSIAVSVFSTEAPFKLFFLIGWGLPAIVIVAWAIVMHFTNFEKCWDDYSQSKYTYIVLAPFLAALIVNLIFLINIIRILVTKLRANNTQESDRIKKAIKATIVLLPLLGLTNILFLWNPEDGSTLQTAYHVINAVLQSTQGIMVSIFYCFMNGEVRRVIKRKWDRFKIRRFLSSNRRRRTSRTSSFVMSQTEPRPTHNAAIYNHVDLNSKSDDQYEDVNENHVTPETPVSTKRIRFNDITPSHETPDYQIPLLSNNIEDEDAWVKNTDINELRETALLGDDDDEIEEKCNESTFNDTDQNISYNAETVSAEQHERYPEDKTSPGIENGRMSPVFINGHTEEAPDDAMDEVVEPLHSGSFKNRPSCSSHSDSAPFVSAANGKAASSGDEWDEVLQIMESFQSFQSDIPTDTS